MAKSTPPTLTLACRPFLKWAGNKYRVLEMITKALPPGKRLIEPFSGSAAVSLNTNYSRYWLNDLNQDLIDLYRQLADCASEYIDYAASFFTEENNQEKNYYQLREVFNNTNDNLERSALFLYLNRHSYNGLCRYNKKGLFNAPFGSYKKIYFPKNELTLFAEKAKHIKLTHESFEKVMQRAKPGDVVYCDPPYVPLSDTANFTKYYQHDFGTTEQEQLADLAEMLANNGISVIISNHNTAYTRKIYQQARLKKFTVPRFISCKADQRLPAKELLAIYTAKV
jgi:DNA adenine methylase